MTLAVQCARPYVQLGQSRPQDYVREWKKTSTSYPTSPGCWDGGVLLFGEMFLLFQNIMSYLSTWSKFWQIPVMSYLSTWSIFWNTCKTNNQILINCKTIFCDMEEATLFISLVPPPSPHPPPSPPPRSRAYVCVCVCFTRIVKRPVLPPCAVDGRSRNPLYYYY